jgi:hypothetical protein
VSISVTKPSVAKNAADARNAAADAVGTPSPSGERAGGDDPAERRDRHGGPDDDERDAPHGEVREPGKQGARADY